MYVINFIAVANALQLSPSDDEFFQAIDGVDLTALEAIISESPAAAGQAHYEAETPDHYDGDDEPPLDPQKNARRGAKMIPAGPFVRLRLWCLYPGTGAPPRLGTLHQRLKKRGDDLAKRCGFIDGVPDRKTILKRYHRLDFHEQVIKEALRSISARLVQPYLMPPDPEPPLEQDELIHRGRTKECNETRKRSAQGALGDEEFEELIPRGSGGDDFLLRHLHGDHITCHKCEPGDCNKDHDHGLTERPSRELKCPSPKRHDGGCIHEVRRQWKCRCCGAHVSVTSGIKRLHNMKIPLRKLLRGIHHMVHSRYGISALSMGCHLNTRWRTMRHLTALDLKHFIQEAMQEPYPLPFRGTVEIDEAKVKLKDGYVNLIGAYDHATRRVYIEILDGPATQEVMRDFVERVSLPGSRVDTDGTAAWPPGIDRIHGVVIHNRYDFGHAEELYGKGDGRFYITTNRIEGSWGLLRRALRIPATITCKYFPLYLAEEMWRMNHLRNRVEAENYKDEERRGAALMGQIVASMGNRRLNTKELQESDETGSNLAAAEPSFSHEPATSDCDPPELVEMPLAG